MRRPSTYPLPRRTVQALLLWLPEQDQADDARGVKGTRTRDGGRPEASVRGWDGEWVMGVGVDREPRFFLEGGPPIFSMLAFHIFERRNVHFQR